MKTKSILLAGLIAFSMMIMTTCSNSVDDSEEAILTINFTSFEENAAVQSVSNRIIYAINIEGEESLSKEARFGEDVQVPVAAGYYNILVTAFLDNTASSPYATGKEENKKVSAGPNKVSFHLDFTNSVKTPTASPGTYTYTTEQNIELKSETSDADIYYTMTANGTEPGVPSRSSTKYNSVTKIKVNTPGVTKIRAIAVKDGSGLPDSAIMQTETYTMNATWTATPNGNPNTTTTTAITFAFSLPVTLTTLDITITNLTGTNTGNFTHGKASLSGSGQSYTLNGTVTRGGTITASISKANMSGSQTVTLNAVWPIWTQVTNSTFGVNNVHAITYGGGKFVAVGTGGKVAWSTDGINWNTATADTSNHNLYAVTYGNGYYVAGGGGGKIVYSNDANTWTPVLNSTFGSYDIRGVACLEDYYFVAVGQNGIAARAPVNSPGSWASWISGFGQSSIYAITAYSLMCYYVGADGKVGYASALVSGLHIKSFVVGVFGTSWNTIYALGYDGHVIGGQAGKIARTIYSADNGDYYSLKDSTFGSTGGSSDILSICNSMDNASYYVVGGNSGNMAYSTDEGQTWKTADSTFTTPVNGIAYGGVSGQKKWVAVSNTGRISYSPAP